MSNMFTSAEAFSQNLDKWDTSNVTTMNRMFQEAKAFNGDISTWDTKNVVIWLICFWATTFNKDISGWNVEMFQQWKQIKKSKVKNKMRKNLKDEWNTTITK